MRLYLPGAQLPLNALAPAIRHLLAEHAQSLKSLFASKLHAAAVLATGSFAAATHSL